MSKKKNSLKDSIEDRLSKEESSDNSDSVYLSTSSPLLDYRLADRLPGGFKIGKFINIYGKEGIGKTAICLTLLAEAANDPYFDDYKLIYDDAEVASEFDIERNFGSKLAGRLTSPNSPTKENPTGCSLTSEEFYQNILNSLKGTKPVIYILDSLNALYSLEDKKRADKFQKEGEAGGSYGGAAYKLYSEMFRVIKGEVKRTKSIVIIVTQTRAKFDAAKFESKDAGTGGSALKFYVSYILSLSSKKQIKTEYEAVSEIVGREVIVATKKNKATGKKSRVQIDIYDSYGIDGITPTIDFLIKTKHIKKDERKEKGKTIWSKKYIFKDFIGYKKEIVDFIEQNPENRKLLDEMVITACKQMDEALKLPRKKKYE